MKNLIFIILLVLPVWVFSQSNDGSNINVNKMRLNGLIYGNKSGAIDTLLFPNPDSLGQFRITNLSDPVYQLDAVNLQYFINNASGGHAILTLGDSAQAKGFILYDQELEFDYSGYVLKDVYDIDNDSVVDNSEQLSGQILNDSVFSDSWNGSLDIPTRNAVYDKFNTAMAQIIYTISLPSASSVAARISGATEGVDYETGWALAAGASPIDLVITHGLSRRVAFVSVFAVTGNEEQQLFNTAAYNGIITTDANTLKIQSLATILKTIKIYISFVE